MDSFNSEFYEQQDQNDGSDRLIGIADRSRMSKKAKSASLTENRLYLTLEK